MMILSFLSFQSILIQIPSLYAGSIITIALELDSSLYSLQLSNDILCNSHSRTSLLLSLWSNYIHILCLGAASRLEQIRFVSMPK